MVSNQTINTTITGLLLLVILFKLVANLMPEAQAAGDEINASGVPLGSLFSGGGLVFLMIMAALLLTVYNRFKPSGK